MMIRCLKLRLFYGEVAEWSMAPVLKTGEGSNPVLRGFESHPRLYRRSSSKLSERTLPKISLSWQETTYLENRKEITLGSFIWAVMFQGGD